MSPKSSPIEWHKVAELELRCPWHGYDYDPLTGKPPSGFSDAPACFPLEVREDGVYVAVPAELAHERTVSDVMVETMVAWGVTHVFGTR